MRFWPVALAVCVLGTVDDTTAQTSLPRSADYLFVTNVSDARALWVNPSGLSVIPEASLMAEVVMARDVDGSRRIGQYAIALNSRGFSVGYRRDRFADGEGVGILRVGSGLRFTGGALGVAFSMYQVEGPNARGMDAGVMFGLTPSINAGLVVRNIGRPTVDSTEIPLAASAGTQLSAGSRLLLAGQANAFERRGLGESGFDFSYQFGGTVVFGTRRPFSLMTTVALGSDLSFDRLHVGFALGARNRVVLLGTSGRGDGSTDVERLSATGVVSNVLGARSAR